LAKIDWSAPLARDRRQFIGGSDARTIMGKDEKALQRLWLEKRGEAAALDLSGELVVQLGLVTEDLNRRWYERNSGHRVDSVQRHVVHRAIPWMAATLDGRVKETGAVFEAKFMLPWSFSEEAAAETAAERDVSRMRSVRLLRRLMPVTDDYRGTRLTVREHGRRALTPLAVVVVAVFATDMVFAVDSVPAVYGITDDPYLVFATNAFALLGLRALYFVLHTALAKLVHLNHGLAVILAFIGAKLVLHWAHGIWPAVPEIPTPVSLAVIIAVLATVILTSLRSRRRAGPSARRPSEKATTPQD
jgi:predicted tellurium resistance membrane protein TerC